MHNESTHDELDSLINIADADYVRAFQGVVGQAILFYGQVMSTAVTFGADLNITPTHWQVLLAVKGQAKTASQYARRLGMQRQTMQ